MQGSCEFILEKAAARLQSALVLHLTRSLLVDKVMSSAGTSRFSVICCFSCPMVAPSGTWIRSRPSLDDVSVCHGLCKKGARVSWSKQAQDIRVGHFAYLDLSLISMLLRPMISIKIF